MGEETTYRILSLAISGGFLDELVFNFHDGLNCLIGGRGTGKRTVLKRGYPLTIPFFVQAKEGQCENT